MWWNEAPLYQNHNTKCTDVIDNSNENLWHAYGGPEETQFVPELSRFLRDKRGWEHQTTIVRKGRSPLSCYCAMGFPFWCLVCFNSLLKTGDHIGRESSVHNLKDMLLKILLSNNLHPHLEQEFGLDFTMQHLWSMYSRQEKTFYFRMHS